MVTIIDYGMGNIGSIFNMLKKIGVKAIITADPKEINTAQKIILPGVGSFDNGMRNIKELGLLDVLNQSCGDGLGEIDNQCLSAYEEACDYLKKKGILEEVNSRIYNIKNSESGDE